MRLGFLLLLSVVFVAYRFATQAIAAAPAQPAGRPAVRTPAVVAPARQACLGDAFAAWNDGFRGGCAMTSYTKSIEVAAAPERVWAVMTDVERWPEWTPSMTSVTRLEPGPLAPGCRARVEQPRLRPAIFTVTDMTERPARRSFTWRMKGPGVVGVATHTVEPSGSGTRATLTVTFSGLLGGLVALLYRALTQRYLALEAQGLKRRSESGTGM